MTARVPFRGVLCDIEERRYENGRLALRLLCPNGEPMATATVNLPDEQLGAGEVFIKDYSENEGMLAALVKAGVVEDTGRRVRPGFVDIPVARLAVRS